MPATITRRSLLQQAVILSAGVSGLRPKSLVAVDDAAAPTDFVEGMLIGSLIGDAAGGPVEFASAEATAGVLPNCRDWPDDRRLNDDERQQLADTFPLLSYEALRPDAAPYGPWKSAAPAGTITDDSRMKIVLMRSLAAAQSEVGLTKKHVAAEILRFQPRQDQQPDEQLQALISEGLAEYRLAARWVLGERDERRALPVERLWGGVNNCSGQMMMPPLAAAFPGRPEAAYRATFELDFVDAPAARDLCAALNAGLAAVLGADHHQQQSSQRWRLLLQTMRTTDPFRYREIRYVGRRLDHWLDLAERLAAEANGSPKTLYRLLETKGQPVYWWDAHFTLLVPFAMLHFCQFDALAALHLCLDFRHDTDSYAQLLGAMAGAVHGTELFPAALRRQVSQQLQIDYGETIHDWAALLNRTGAAAR